MSTQITFLLVSISFTDVKYLHYIFCLLSYLAKPGALKCSPLVCSFICLALTMFAEIDIGTTGAEFASHQHKSCTSLPNKFSLAKARGE